MTRTLKCFILFSFCLLSANSFAQDITVVTRPASKQEGKKYHLIIISDSLPHGFWEVGPDSQGKIASTNTIANLKDWKTNIETQKYENLEDKDISKKIVKVNGKGLIDAINLYEHKIVGLKYKKGDDNYAVKKTIYGAGGPNLE